MNTRRDFLKGAGAATGIVFCSCGLRDAAWAQQGGGQRLPVMVNGKRVKTIDVHAHCHFREAVALMGDEASRVLSQTRGAQENFIVIEERLKGMDAQAIDMEVLSINPFWYRKDRDTAAQIVRSKTKNWPNCALRVRTASPPSPRSPCNIRTWRCSNSRVQ
jgi:aminocarboxymuconate-semialdehyde decarboxylase